MAMVRFNAVPSQSVKAKINVYPSFNCIYSNCPGICHNRLGLVIVGETIQGGVI